MHNWFSQFYPSLWSALSLDMIKWDFTIPWCDQCKKHMHAVDQVHYKMLKTTGWLSFCPSWDSVKGVAPSMCQRIFFEKCNIWTALVSGIWPRGAIANADIPSDSCYCTGVPNPLPKKYFHWEAQRSQISRNQIQSLHFHFFPSIHLPASWEDAWEKMIFSFENHLLQRISQKVNKEVGCRR